MTSVEGNPRDYRASLLDDESDEFSAWSTLKGELLREVLRTRGVRLTSRDETQFKKKMR